MLRPATLFRLASEALFVLLGVLLMWVAISGRLFFDRRARPWIMLGVFLVLWGARAAWRARSSWTRREAAEGTVRGASLALVGAMMLGAAWLPFGYVGPLLTAAGGVLILRGLVSAVLVARAP